MESKDILESFMPSQFPLDKFDFVKIDEVPLEGKKL